MKERNPEALTFAAIPTALTSTLSLEFLVILRIFNALRSCSLAIENRSFGSGCSEQNSTMPKTRMEDPF
jgi:hypothetical protein